MVISTRTQDVREGEGCSPCTLLIWHRSWKWAWPSVLGCRIEGGVCSPCMCCGWKWVGTGTVISAGMQDGRWGGGCSPCALLIWHCSWKQVQLSALGRRIEGGACSPYAHCGWEQARMQQKMGRGVLTFHPAHLVLQLEMAQGRNRHGCQCQMQDRRQGGAYWRRAGWRLQVTQGQLVHRPH